MEKEKNERVCIQLLHAILALKSYRPSIKKTQGYVRLKTPTNNHFRNPFRVSAGASNSNMLFC